MRLVIISDTHQQHRQVELPDEPGQILIHCGDWQRLGHDVEEIDDFNDWLGEQSHKFLKILVIAGNHDALCEQLGAGWVQKKFTNAIYLEDSGCKIGGRNFWGSPWQPEFGDWHFNLPRGKALAEKWSLIPDNTDVLITHAPPQGMFDECPAWRPPRRRGKNIEHAGCADLMEAVQRIEPRVHCFGHIHEGGGKMRRVGKTTFVNASTCTRQYKPTNPPMIVDI